MASELHAPARNRGEPLLRVENLVKHFPVTKGLILTRQIGAVKAVDGVSLEVHHGETLGLVGESGCGKTTVGRSILGLERPRAGRIWFDGVDLLLSPTMAVPPLEVGQRLVIQGELPLERPVSHPPFAAQ